MADLKGVSVTDLNATLEDPEVLDAFREFLRIKLDNNKSTNIDLKKKFEQWLDYVIICNKIFSLAEEDIEDCINLMVEVGERFIAKPPGGYNIALAGQLNRKALEQHCKELGDKTTLDPDTGLLRPGYEFILDGLSKKHDIFRKTVRPRTTLHALLCTLS